MGKLTLEKRREKQDMNIRNTLSKLNLSVEKVKEQKMCDYEEEYTETENYTDYINVTKLECHNETVVVQDCKIQPVDFSVTNHTCITNPVGLASCALTNFDNQMQNFQIEIGFIKADGTKVSEQQTKYVDAGNSATFIFQKQEIFSKCFYGAEMLTKQVCSDNLKEIEKCENADIAEPVAKQKKVTKYKTVQKPC